MGEDYCYLITVLCGDNLLRCALKTPCMLENFHREEIADMLPLHVRSCGPIVQVERIFEVNINNSVRGPE